MSLFNGFLDLKTKLVCFHYNPLCLSMDKNTSYVSVVGWDIYLHVWSYLILTEVCQNLSLIFQGNN